MKIKDLKTIKDVTYEELSKSTGIKETYLYTRRFKNINQLTLEDSVKLSEYLNITLEELYQLSKRDVDKTLENLMTNLSN